MTPQAPSPAKKQSVLVLGADGFIGGHVLEGLARWAEPIAAVSRPSGFAKRSYGRVIDLANTAVVESALQSVDSVVNCVASNPTEIVDCAQTLFTLAARLSKPVRIVHFSSMTVYGSAVGVVDESAPLLGDLGAYSAAQVRAEAAAASYPRVVIFRPGCEFGPGAQHWGWRIASYLKAHRLGDLGAAGDGACNLVDIEDVVQAVNHALTEAQLETGPFNLSHPQMPTWNELLTRFGIALRAVPIRRISQRQLRLESKVVAPGLKIAEILAGRLGLRPDHVPPPISPSLIRLMSQDIRLDAQRAQSRLGVSWRELDQTLNDTARWFLGAQGGARSA